MRGFLILRGTPILLAGMLGALVLAPVPGAIAADPPTPTPQAASPSTQVVVSVTGGSPVTLIIDGVPVDKLPAATSPGSEVCLSDVQYYGSTTERWLFTGWSNGATDRCVVFAFPGAYRAQFSHQVVLSVRSVVPAYQSSRWLEAGMPVTLYVAAQVDTDPGVRFRFQEWSDGDTPFLPRTVIAPVKPTTVETKWIKEYFINVAGSGDAIPQGAGWYADGSNAVLQAQSEIPGSRAGERFKFTSWSSMGTPVLAAQSPQTPVTGVKVDSPALFQANYNKEYLVVVQTPFATLKRDWLQDGAELPLETQPIVETIPERERYVFKRWEGQAGLTSPKITGTVTGPLTFQAVYAREVKVAVAAPHGAAGEGWYEPGSTATISVPSSAEKALLLRDYFVSFPGYSSSGSTIQVLVQDPVTINAFYETKPDIALIALLLLILLLLLLFYFGYRNPPRWFPLRRALTRVPEASREISVTQGPGADTVTVRFAGSGGAAKQPDAGMVAVAPPAPGPVLASPTDIATSEGSTLLKWTNPPMTTQYQIQIVPFNNDGPGINLFRNAEESYTVRAPSFGSPDANYVLLPGMSYVWRVRTTTSLRAAALLGEHDWTAWSAGTFVAGRVSSGTIQLDGPAGGNVVEGATPTLRWTNADQSVFYYEVQVSTDPSFGPDAFLYWELRHGGLTSPLDSYTIPNQYPLSPGATYYWRVRPRIQGDGVPLDWTVAADFQTP